MKGQPRRLVQFLEGTAKRFIIPVYQRNYDWKSENCIQLYNDLVNVVKQKKETHFFGSVVSYNCSRNEIVIIDGQQRITTVSLILIAMVNAMKKGKCVPQDSTLCDRIMNEFIVDKYQKTERKVRLKPFRDDCDAFDNLIYKNEDDFLPNSRVTINYRFFYDKITKDRTLTVDELYSAIDSLEIIDIELEPSHGDDPQLIFESLNSTGLDLTESDKIRNFVLMNLPPDIQENYYDTYWNKIERHCRKELDGFVRNYLTIKTSQIPTMSGIYPAFKNYAKGINDIETVLKDMLIYAEAYERITTFSLGNADINEVAKRLEKLDITVAYPFLMAFLVYSKNEGIGDIEIFKVFSCIETFIFRRLMCGLPTNALNKIFATLHNSVIRFKTSGISYSDIMIFSLESRKASGAFPKDAEFITGFTTKNVYSMKGKNKEYIFDRLENGSSKEKIDISANMATGILTIEHIMPQTLSLKWEQALGPNWREIHEKWQHCIANLTLTGYNSKYSNLPFKDKKYIENGFCQSGLRLNQYIATFDKWTEEELDTRNAKLAEMALKIWPYPETSFVPPVNEGDTSSLSDDTNAQTGRQIQYYEFFGDKIAVQSWADLLWKVVNTLFELDPTILYDVAKSDNVWFMTETDDPDYHKLADGLYFCNSKSNTYNKIAILKNLFKLYGLDEDELTFVLKPIDDTGRS